LFMTRRRALGLSAKGPKQRISSQIDRA